VAVKKPKVSINAGATVVVEIDGAQHKFSCSGVNTGKETPENVIQKIQDCVKSSIAKATKKGVGSANHR
jgi:hypothetical protein